MLNEIYRVLSPGSRFITFSLHSIEEIINYYENKEFIWKVHPFRVKSNRWNETTNRRRSIAHTMFVCDKPAEDGVFPLPNPRDFDSQLFLSQQKYEELKKRADKVFLFFLYIVIKLFTVNINLFLLLLCA